MMVVQVAVGGWCLPLGLFLNFAIGGLAGYLFKGDTTRGYAYSYLSPDNASFSIWGLIYALQFGLVVFHSCSTKLKGMADSRPYLFLNYLTNGTWLLVNGASHHGLSYYLAVVVLWLNLYSLYKVYFLLNVDYSAKVRGCCSGNWTKLTAFLAVSCNFAWVSIAAVLNLVNTVYDENSTAINRIGGPDFSIAALAVVTVIACHFVFTRLDIGIAGIVVWALLGIQRNQLPSSESPLEPSETLGVFATGCCVVVCLSYVMGLLVYSCSAKPKGKENTVCEPLLMNKH